MDDDAAEGRGFLNEVVDAPTVAPRVGGLRLHLAAPGLPWKGDEWWNRRRVELRVTEEDDENAAFFFRPTNAIYGFNVLFTVIDLIYFIFFG